MGRLTPDEFRKKYAELPENLREAYGSIKTTEILEEIGKKHGLLIDDIGELVDETGYIMLGATPPGEYIKKLSDAIGIPREKAREIAVDVNEQVFKPIREALKRVHKIGTPPVPANEKTPPSEPSFAAPLRAEPSDVRVEAFPNIRREGEARPPLQESVPIKPAESTREKPTPVFPLKTESPQEKTAPFSPPANLSEERLTKTFSLPHQEKSYTLSETGDEETPPTRTYPLDPYREPTD